MTIHNFRSFFFGEEGRKGQLCFERGGIKKVEKLAEGKYRAAISHDRYKSYEVYASVRSDGLITELSCNCGYVYGRCYHTYALLYYLSRIFDDVISDLSSPSFSRLLSDYSMNLESQAQRPVSAEAELFWAEDQLAFKLKIGRERKYIIPNIRQFMDDCVNHITHTYGKNFTWKHNLSALDAKSRHLIHLALAICEQHKNSFSYSCKEFPLNGTYLERFLSLSDTSELIIAGEMYAIVQEHPPLKAILKNTNRNKLLFSMVDAPLFLGCAEKGYFISKKNRKFYETDMHFTEAVRPLLEVMHESDHFLIAQKDVPAFFHTILRQLEPYMEIDMTALKETDIPPQLICQLYIDVDDADTIIGMLQFSYGGSFYSAFQPPVSHPYMDPYGEKLAKELVGCYFEINENDEVHPLRIRDDDAAFRLMHEGLSELSRQMELYVSDHFRSINLRKPIQPQVGIKPSGHLLELDFSAAGYTMQELAEMLDAYRKGKKYHRFRDGSFSLVDDSIRDLDILTKELNITDKALLKERITVPMYRMLYLNSLQTDTEHLRFKRSNEFKQAAKDYENALRDENLFTLSDHLETIMRDYQKYGFRWMKTLGQYHMGGILADDMGLGKTIQAIALMLNEKLCTAEGQKKQFLVVCPSSLTLNWLSEIEKFAPQLKALCMTGTVAERNKLFDILPDYDVIITSYATILRDIDKYESLHFAVQFLDEAQNIKNHQTQSAKAVKVIHSDLRFALTGTPVENTLAELWSIFDFIMPGYLHNYSYFKKNYEIPIVKNSSTTAVSSLQRLTSPFILRRMKKEVLTELPDKTETILMTEMQEQQKKLYLANALQVRQKLNEMDQQQDKIQILALLTRLRQICCDPSLIYENYDGGHAKLDQCIDLITSGIESGHKILLFSQFTSMLDIIAARLQQENISFYMLTGATKTKDRLRMVNEFNKNDVSIFLISLKAGGTGLNLTGADIVIHYDPWWNLSAENQASDRVHRIGQKNNVQIYKLIVKGTIEEKIRLLQQKKAELLETAIGGEGNIINMTIQDIMALL